MTDYATALRLELSAAIEQAGHSPPDRAAVFEAVDRFAELIRVLDATRREAGVAAKALIGEGIRSGVDPRDFYDRPFSGTIVRDVAAGVGVTFPHRGRRPRATGPAPEK